MLIVIASIGLTLILKYSYILKIPREYLQDKSFILKEFLSCCMCMGFWVGLILSYIMFCAEHNTITTEYRQIYICILYGFVSSFLSYVSDIILEYMDTKIYETQKRYGRKEDS